MNGSQNYYLLPKKGMLLIASDEHLLPESEHQWIDADQVERYGQYSAVGSLVVPAGLKMFLGPIDSVELAVRPETEQLWRLDLGIESRHSAAAKMLLSYLLPPAQRPKAAQQQIYAFEILSCLAQNDDASLCNKDLPAPYLAKMGTDWVEVSDGTKTIRRSLPQVTSP